MRNAFIVSYDVADPRRVQRTFKLMRGWGDHLQLSVFRCDLTPKERIELEAALSDVLNLNQDQVLFIDLGPTEGRGGKAIQALGRPYTCPERHAVVV